MSIKDTYCSNESLSTVISSGTSLSSTVNLYGVRLCAVVLPAAWTTANITVQASTDNGATWSNLYDQDGDEITLSADASRCVVVDPMQFAALQYLRFRSGTNATPVAQGGDRILQLILRAF